MKNVHPSATKMARESPAKSSVWYTSVWITGAALLVLAFVVYSAVLRTPFLFDDFGLMYANPLASQSPLKDWVSGVRPILQFSYWLNYGPPPTSTLPFHVTNIVLHGLNAFLLFGICLQLFRRYLPDESRAFSAACFSSALFLLHPLQTESVAYIAGRSELLSATFVLSAWWIYVRRIGRPVSGQESAILLLLFGLAAASKEQAVATLPAIFLLTDWIFPRFSAWREVRNNKRLYLPLGLGALAGAAWVASVLLTSKSAGPNAGVSALDYLFTQFRAIGVYLQLFVLPIGQNADREFPISHSLLEHNAALFLLVLAGLTVFFLRQKPLLRYGWLLFLAFLAPTSSIVPLADTFAERRMYLPMASLTLLVGAALAQLVFTRRIALAYAACLGLAAFATIQRAQVWSDAMLFWQDIAEKSPSKPRAYQHLAHAYISSGQCQAAIDHLEKVKNGMPRDYFVLLNWAQAYRCVDRGDAALEKLREAEQLAATATVYGLMGETLLKLNRREEAQRAFAQAAEKEPPGTELSHVYKGNLAYLAQDYVQAQEWYQQAVAINPYSPEAASLLSRLRAAYGTNERSRTSSPPPRVLPFQLPGQFVDKRLP